MVTDVDSIGVVSQLVRTTSVLRSHVERTVLRGEGLRWADVDTLQIICVRPPVAARAVVTEAGISRARLAESVVRLVDRGLIEQVLPHGERRRVLLRPTADGVAFATRIATPVREQERILLEAVPGADGLLEILAALAGRAQELATEAHASQRVPRGATVTSLLDPHLFDIAQPAAARHSGGQASAAER